MTSGERVSVGVTVGLIVTAIVVACFSVHYSWILWLAVSVGALGGLTHEIAQSGGKFALPQMRQDGLYLGSISGMVLGLVAGLLVVRGDLAAQGDGLRPGVNMVRLAYEIFLAGLALKGVTEAAAGQSVPLQASGKQPGGGRTTDTPADPHHANPRGNQ